MLHLIQIALYIIATVPVLDCSKNTFKGKGKCLCEVHSFTYPKYISKKPHLIVDKLKCQKQQPTFKLVNNTCKVQVVGMEAWKDKVWVTTPRIRSGSPATLSTLRKLPNNKESYLEPYPNWKLNRPRCSGMVSVYGIKADNYNKLWVLDSGVLYALSKNKKRICKPKILIFDLLTDKITATIYIPEKVLYPESLLTNIDIDIRKEHCCQDTFVYMTDSCASQIIVYNVDKKRAWSMKDKHLLPEEAYSSFHINEANYDTLGGFIPINVGPLSKQCDRKVYFHSLSSNKEYYIPASNLQDPSYCDDEMVPNDFSAVKLIGEKCCQTHGETICKDGIMFMGLIGKNTLACVSPRDKFNGSDVENLVKDDKRLTFITDMKAHGNDLWFINSALYKLFAFQKLNPKEINYRIFKASIGCLTEGTNCKI